MLTFCYLWHWPKLAQFHRQMPILKGQDQFAFLQSLPKHQSGKAMNIGKKLLWLKVSISIYLVSKYWHSHHRYSVEDGLHYPMHPTMGKEKYHFWMRKQGLKKINSYTCQNQGSRHKEKIACWGRKDCNIKTFLGGFSTSTSNFTINLWGSRENASIKAVTLKNIGSLKFSAQVSTDWFLNLPRLWNCLWVENKSHCEQDDSMFCTIYPIHDFLMENISPLFYIKKSHLECLFTSDINPKDWLFASSWFLGIWSPPTFRNVSVGWSLIIKNRGNRYKIGKW